LSKAEEQKGETLAAAWQTGGNPRNADLGQVPNTIFYAVRSSCQ